MKLVLYFIDATLESDIITSNFTYVQNYYNKLNAADNYVKCSIPFNVNIANYIKGNINYKVKAIIKNDNNTDYFSGYLKQDASVSKLSQCENISLEIVSPSYLLDVTFKNSTCKINQTITQCVTDLLTYAGISNYSISNLPNKNILVFEMYEGDKVRDVLAKLLLEYGYTYDFNESATFIVNELFDSAPSTISQIFGDATSQKNMLGKVTQKVQPKQYDGVSAQFDVLEYQQNQLVFDDSSTGELAAGAYYYEGGSNGAKCNYEANDKSVKVITAIDSWNVKTDANEISNTNPQASGLSGEITNGYEFANAIIKSEQSTLQNKKQVQIYGSGYFITSTGKSKVTEGNNIQEVELKYIFNADDAQSFAEKLCNYYRYASGQITLNSKTDYVYGSFVKVQVEYLGIVTGRIIQKTRTLQNDVISYVIEAISEFTPASVATSYTNMPKVFRGYSNHIVTLYKKYSTAPSTTGITGIATYSFTHNELTWNGNRNGWTDNYASLTGDGTTYITTATAYGNDLTDSINPNEWAEPIPMGNNGLNGYNTRTIQFFQRADAMPTALPQTFTVDFSSRDLSLTPQQLNGWQTSFPEINASNDPCWEIHVTALSTTTTDTITSAQWSTPAKISQDVEITQSQIQDMINSSIEYAANPIVSASVTYGGYYVDADGIASCDQSIKTVIKVTQAGDELEFTFGDITLPSGFESSHVGNELTLKVKEGTLLKTGTIKIPISYQPYVATENYGDEDGYFYVDEDGTNYGYWMKGDKTITYEVPFAYTFVRGERYLNKALNLAFTSTSHIPSDAIVGDYFTWMGANNTTYSNVEDGKLMQSSVYKWNGYTWKKDSTPSHLQSALSDVLANAKADLAENCSDVVQMFRRIVANEAVVENLVVTGNAFINALHAVDIYADKFESYDTEAQRYASEALEGAVDEVFGVTGINTLEDKTIISGGKIKTGLLQVNAIVSDYFNNGNKINITDVDDLTNNLNSKANNSTLNDKVAYQQVVYKKTNIINTPPNAPVGWIETEESESDWCLIHPTLAADEEKLIWSCVQFKDYQNNVTNDSVVLHYDTYFDVTNGILKTRFINTSSIVIGQGQVSGLDSALNSKASETYVDDVFNNTKNPNSIKCIEQTNGTLILSNAIKAVHGSLNYDTHYYKYCVTDNAGNSLTELVKYRYEYLIEFKGTVSNGITRTAQNVYGTITFTSINNIKVWEITQIEYDSPTYSDNKASAAESNAKQYASTQATSAKNDAIDIALAQFVGSNNVRNHTIIDGGKITSGLIDVDAIKATAGFFENITVSGLIKSKYGFNTINSISTTGFQSLKSFMTNRYDLSTIVNKFISVGVGDVATLLASGTFYIKHKIGELDYSETIHISNFSYTKQSSSAFIIYSFYGSVVRYSPISDFNKEKISATIEYSQATNKVSLMFLHPDTYITTYTIDDDSFQIMGNVTF